MFIHNLPFSLDCIFLRPPPPPDTVYIRLSVHATRTSRIERARARDICLCFGQSRATVEHNDVINILGLHSKHRANLTPIGYVSLCTFKF